MAETPNLNGQQPVNQEPSGPQFIIQRIYVKDMSLEVPNSPKVFLEKWEPQLHMDLATKTEALDNSNHEVVLTVTITVKISDKTAFVVEVKQAGIFSLTGFTEEQLRPMLGAFCPNILYPYVRETITSTVMRAGFPQLYLTPVNFDALFQQHEKERQTQGDTAQQ